MYQKIQRGSQKAGRLRGVKGHNSLVVSKGRGVSVPQWVEAIKATRHQSSESQKANVRGPLVGGTDGPPLRFVMYCRQ